jgi:hypothetical protein
MIAFVQVSSQSFILPTKILDSLIFEAKKGRECDSLQRKQALEIKALDNELLASKEIIKLKTTENEQFSIIIVSLNNTLSLKAKESEIEKSKLKTRIRHLWVTVVSEGAVIILLILII